MTMWSLLSRGLAAGALIGTLGCGATSQGTVAATHTESPSSSTFESEEFEWPVSVTLPENWIAYETGEAVVMTAPLVDPVPAERAVLFRSEGGTPAVEVFVGFEESGNEEGRPIGEPWPSDVESWLSSLEMFEVNATDETTIADSPATLIEATSDFQPHPARPADSLRFILVGPASDGTDVVAQTGEMLWRFLIFEDRPLVLAYGATVDDFSEEHFELIVESLRINEA